LSENEKSGKVLAYNGVNMVEFFSAGILHNFLILCELSNYINSSSSLGATSSVVECFALLNI
jgi:hypothetical protein